MNNILLRKIEQKIFHIIFLISTLLVISALLSIIALITSKALPVLNLEYLLTPEINTGFAQGCANAIVGSIYIGVFSVVFSLPFAVGTAVYLKKYAKRNRFTYLVELFIDILSGTPSVVIGMLGFMVMAWQYKWLFGGFTLLAGIIAVGTHIIPIMTRTIIESIKTVPKIIEEGSYALGASKWETIENITLPSSLQGILSSIIMGLGLAMGESAIVILTAGYSLYIPEIGIIPSSKTIYGFLVLPFQQSVGSLPYLIYKSYMNPLEVPENYAFAAAFVLMALVITLNIIAKITMYQYSKNSK